MTDTPSLSRSIQAQFREAKALCRRAPVPIQREVLPETFCGKSVAQVESVVAPHSGGLKPDGSTLPLAYGGSTARKRPTPLAVRFSEVELEIVKSKAKAVGVTTNSYIRAAALGSNYKPPANPELTSALLGLNRELTAQGTNLNQIARRVNGTSATEAQADSLLGMLGRSMLRTHRAIRAALSWGKGGEQP